MSNYENWDRHSIYNIYKYDTGVIGLSLRETKSMVQPNLH